MPKLASWASTWAHKALKRSTSAPGVNLSLHGLLRDALLQHASQLAHVTSNAFLTYSRILCAHCLYRAEASEIRPSENWLLLKALCTLFQIDCGYSSALLHHIVSLLKSQPNSSKEDRNRLLTVFGRQIRDSALPPPEVHKIVQMALGAIPKNLLNTKNKEMVETGHMWARIAQHKKDAFPPTLIPELQRSLDAVSLPNLLSSKNSVSTCATLVDMAFRFVIALERQGKMNQHSKALRASILRIYELINANINVIRKAQPIELLECKLMRALAAIQFEKIFPALVGILEDDTGNNGIELKREALKCLIRRMIQHPQDEVLRKALENASRKFLDTAIQSPLKALCSQIVTYVSNCDVNQCLPIPTITETNGAGGDSFGFSSSLFSLHTLDDGFRLSPLKTMSITCSECLDELEDVSTEQGTENSSTLCSGPAAVTYFTDFFDSMTTFERELETLNRYPMSVLTQLEKLADFPDQQDGAFLGALQETLVRQLQNPEEGTHTGLLQWVNAFHTRPVAQKELILCVLRAPTLLSNPLFLYHLSRVSLGFQVASASISMLYAQQYAQATQQEQFRQSAPPTDLNASDMEVNLNGQENLKKRKEMALKMIDDLEFSEGYAEKRFSREVDSSSSLLPDESTHTIPASVNHAEEPAQTAKRTTRSQAKLPKSSASSSSDSAKKTSKKAEKRTSSTTHPDAVHLSDSPISSAVSPSITSKSEGKKAKSTGSAKKTATSKEKTRTPRKREVCNLWLQHRCYKGDDCPYLHAGVQLTFDTICKFHRTGNCTKGAACPYSHDLKSEACFNLVSTGTCKYGDRCAYSHDAGKVQIAKAQADAKKRLEDEEEEKAKKDAQLPFAQHIVPILFQPDYMRPSEGFGVGDTNSDMEVTMEKSLRETTQNSETSTHVDTTSASEVTLAYVPPTLSAIPLEFGKRDTLPISSLPTSLPLPLTAPTLLSPTPPKPLSLDSNR